MMDSMGQVTSNDNNNNNIYFLLHFFCARKVQILNKQNQTTNGVTVKIMRVIHWFKQNKQTLMEQ